MKSATRSASSPFVDSDQAFGTLPIGGLAKRSFELQMLYGMAEPIKAALIKLGYRVRDYSPVGELLCGFGAAMLPALAVVGVVAVVRALLRRRAAG